MDRLEKPLLDCARVARLLGVDVATLGAWRRKEYGPRWYRIGKKIKYSETDLRSWISAQHKGQALDHSSSGGRG